MKRYRALSKYVRGFAKTIRDTLGDDDTGKDWATALREVAKEIDVLADEHRGAVETFLRSPAATDAMLDAFHSTGVEEDRNLAATMLENLLDAAAGGR